MKLTRDEAAKSYYLERTAGWRRGLDNLWSKEGFGTGFTTNEAILLQARQDRRDAAAAQESGIAAAVRGVDHEYHERAMASVRRVALVLHYLTTDDVLDDCPELEQARQRNFLGDVMKKAAAEGWIRNTGRMAASHRKASRGRPKTQWESLIFGRPMRAVMAGAELAEAVR